MHGFSIRHLYFEFRPVAGHMAACSRAGTDVWEVTRYRWLSLHDEVRETVIRYACHECGVVAFESAGGDMSFEGTSCANVGYASKPVKVARVWLWPGPPIYHGDKNGPTAYYITTVRTRPRDPGDVAGVVGWYLHGPRRAVRWSAGVGLGPHGGVMTDSGVPHKSRLAAATWVVQNLPPKSS